VIFVVFRTDLDEHLADFLRLVNASYSI
jgi:hypothetical protein